MKAGRGFRARSIKPFERGLTKAREEEYKALLTPWIDPSFWFQNALVHACWGQHPRRRPTP